MATAWPSLFYITIALYSLHLASGQQCPYGWYGYSTTSKCYRFVTNTKLGWQPARDFCQLHGGDLLRLDSVAEKNWVYSQIRNIAGHNKQVTPSNWWTGLNNQQNLAQWQWADGTVAKFINWKRNEPNNAGSGERCGEIMYGSQFNDETCADKDFFICSRNRGIPLNCDADRGWQTLNARCYKVYGYRRTWVQAQHQCSHDGGSFAIADNAVVQTTFHDFAATAKQPLWIGVHSLKTGTTTNTWIMPNGTQIVYTYWHTAAAPKVDRNHLNSTCAYVSNTNTALQNWNPSPCTNTRGFLCQKPEGVCFPGWIGHRGYCYQFDAIYRLSFTAATQFCQNQGTELMRIATASDEAFLLSYLDEMRDSGVSSFWIGLSDNNKDGGPFKWRNGQTVSNAVKNNWVTHNHVPVNTAHKQDCVYISTNDGAGKWRTTTNCASTKAFVCRLPMDRTLKMPPNTPRPHYGCPTGWRLHKDTCFRLYDRSVDGFTAQSRCQATKGATAAKIINADMQNFVNGMIKNRGVAYFIGLNDLTTDNVFVWNSETTPTTYTNWAQSQPSDPSNTKNCVILRNNQWYSVKCQERHMYICSLLASKYSAPSLQFIVVANSLETDQTPGYPASDLAPNCLYWK